MTSTVTTSLGLGLGWSLAARLVFGLALSGASTVLLLWAMQARDLINTPRGRIAVGWLIVEELAMVTALVLLPPLAELIIPEGFEAGAIALAARSANPQLTIFARNHSDEEVAHLQRHGADHVVMGERELARRLIAMLAMSRQAAT